MVLGVRFLDCLTCCLSLLACKDVPIVVNGMVFRLELVWFRVGWWKTTELLRPLHFLRAWMTKMDGPAVADGSGSMPDGINSLSGVDVNVLWEPFGLIWFCSVFSSCDARWKVHFTDLLSSPLLKSWAIVVAPFTSYLFVVSSLSTPLESQIYGILYTS